MTQQQASFWDRDRMTMEDAIERTRQSLLEYGLRYRHWCIAFSGGKDSTATVSIVHWLITSQQIPTPETLTVLYADTRQELPPLYNAAMGMLAHLREQGVETHVVLPEIDKRYFVYMLGRGVAPPNNATMRWCTRQIKIDPMNAELTRLREQHGQKFLMLTGIRKGESAVRDARIALSCSMNGGECGQGWFQETTPKHIADTLAPILHWRMCYIWDWLAMFAPSYGYPTAGVAEAYGMGIEGGLIEMGARTGCIGCPLASKETALENILKMPQWTYLKPLQRLKPLYEELRKFKWRLQKSGERKKDGTLRKRPNRKGPLTMEAREYGLSVVLGVQNDVNEAAGRLGRPGIDLINPEEEARIRELWALNTWPGGWDGTEINGAVLIPEILNEHVTQPIMEGL